MAVANGYVAVHHHSASTQVYKGRVLKSQMKWKTSVQLLCSVLKAIMD